MTLNQNKKGSLTPRINTMDFQTSNLKKIPKNPKNNIQNNDSNESTNTCISSTRKKFSFEEDEKIKDLVKIYGSRKWNKIAKEIPGRTGRQCRDRYNNYLVPGYFNGQWSKLEDELLLEKYIELGPQWSKITKFFFNRSSNSIKNRWNYFVSKHLINDEIRNKINKKFGQNDKKNQKVEKTPIDDKEIEKIINFASSLNFLVNSNEQKTETNSESSGFPCFFNDII